MHKTDMMKSRTIEDLHDKNIGHKNFAKIVDELIAHNIKITDIKEFNTKFKFKADGFDFEYSKDWKESTQTFVRYFTDVLKLQKEVAKCVKN